MKQSLFIFLYFLSGIYIYFLTFRNSIFPYLSWKFRINILNSNLIYFKWSHSDYLRFDFSGSNWKYYLPMRRSKRLSSTAQDCPSSLCHHPGGMSLSGFHNWVVQNCNNRVSMRVSGVNVKISIIFPSTIMRGNLLAFLLLYSTLSLSRDERKYFFSLQSRNFRASTPSDWAIWSRLGFDSDDRETISFSSKFLLYSKCTPKE